MTRHEIENKDKQTQWFVEPEGSYTNEVIARRLQALGEIVYPCEVMVDNFKQTHSVYLLPNHKIVGELYRSKKDLNLKFKIYNRTGHVGTIRLWTLEERKKKVVIKKKIATEVN